MLHLFAVLALTTCALLYYLTFYYFPLLAYSVTCSYFETDDSPSLDSFSLRHTNASTPGNFSGHSKPLPSTPPSLLLCCTLKISLNCHVRALTTSLPTADNAYYQHDF